MNVTLCGFWEFEYIFECLFQNQNRFLLMFVLTKHGELVKFLICLFCWNCLYIINKSLPHIIVLFCVAVFWTFVMYRLYTWWIPSCVTLFYTCHSCWHNVARIICRLTVQVRHLSIIFIEGSSDFDDQRSYQIHCWAHWVIWASCGRHYSARTALHHPAAVIST